MDFGTFLAEHVLNAFSIVYFAKVCLDRDDLYEELFRVQLSHLFIVFPYSVWIAIVGKVVNVIATFCWNYMDLFVMMISAGLSTRFKQINEDLQRIKGKVKTKRCKYNSIQITFNKLRIKRFIAYVRGLLGATKNAISKIVCLVCGSWQSHIANHTSVFLQ